MRVRTLIVGLCLVLAALAAAQAPAPLTQADIDRLLSGGVSPARAAVLVDQQGVAFDPTPIYLQGLGTEEKSEPLVTAVRAAGIRRISARADAGLKEKKWAQAEQDYRALIALGADSPAVQTSLGTALLGLNRNDAAIVAFADALAREPNSAAAHRGMGIALQRRGDLAGANTELTRAAQLDPSDAAAQAALGDVRLALGDTDGAIQSYLAAQKLDPAAAPPRLGLARAWEKKGDLAGAEAQYRGLLASYPNDAPAHYGLGTLLEKKGELHLALDHFRAAFTGDPANEDYRKAYDRCVAALAVAAAKPRAPEPVGTGLIYVYRKSRFVGGLGTWDVILDSTPVAKLGNGRRFTLKVPAGRHMLTAEYGRHPLSINVEPNGEYYVASEIVSEFFSSYVTLKLVPAAQGQAEFNRTRPIEPGRIFDRQVVVEGGEGGAAPQGGGIFQKK